MFTATNDDDSVRLKPAPKGKRAKAKIGQTMSEFSQGTLKSGSGAPVVKKAQAVAIALNQARKAQS